MKDKIPIKISRISEKGQISVFFGHFEHNDVWICFPYEDLTVEMKYRIQNGVIERLVNKDATDF